jgi:hypothetical protein
MAVKTLSIVGNSWRKKKSLTFLSSYRIPLKLIYTFRKLFMRCHLFGWLQNVSALIFFITRSIEHSLTPVEYAGFLTMSCIKMFGFNCNSVLYTLRIICFSDELRDFLFDRFLGGLKIFIPFSLAVFVEDIVHLLAAGQYLQEQENKKYSSKKTLSQYECRLSCVRMQWVHWTNCGKWARFVHPLL